MIGVRSTLPKREILTSQRGSDGRWHAFYPSATRTLCNRVVLDFKPGRKWPPDCGICARTARAFDRIDKSCPPHWRPEAAEAEAA